MRDTYRSFYVVEPGDTVSGIFMKVHGLSAGDVARLLPAIATNNPHLADLNRIQPGQVLDVELTSHDPSMAAHKRGDMEELTRVFASLGPTEQQVVCEQPHVMTVALGLLSDTAVNLADSAAYTLGQLVQEYADATRTYGSALARNYAGNARGTLATELHNLVRLREPVERALGRIPRFVQSLLLEEARRVPSPMRFRQGSIQGEVRKLLRIAPKSVSTYQPFSQVLRRFATVTKHASHAGAAFSVVIPTAVATYNSYEAYGTPKFGRVTAQGVGSVTGGLFGSAAGYVACNLVFGAPSAGTSVFWCGILAGGAAGMLLSNGLGAGAGAIYDAFSGTSPAPAVPNESDRCTIPAVH
jgi:hypothetical protein